MITKMIVLTGLWLLAGCGRDNKIQQHFANVEELVIAKINNIENTMLNPDSAITLPPIPCKESREGYRYPTEILGGIAELSDRSKRAELYELYAERLMAIDLNKVGHLRRRNFVLGIRRTLWLWIPYGMIGRTDAGLDRVYDLRFKCIDWLRKQLYQLRPRREQSKPYNQFNSYKESHEYTRWQDAYMCLYHLLEEFVYDLESENRIISMDLRGRQFLDKKQEEELRDALKKKVEAHLGHPLRTETELNEAKHNHTILEQKLVDEYKAVETSMVAP